MSAWNGRYAPAPHDVCQCGHFGTPEDPLIDGECEECHFANLEEADRLDDNNGES